MIEMTRTQLSAEEFLSLPETLQPTELLEGEMIVSPGPIPQHQDCVGSTYHFLKGLGLPGRLYIAPIDVHLDERHVVQPDVLWIAPDGRCRVLAKYLDGPPDLIVEVISYGTALRDRREKFRLYERHAVREYWLIDPLERYAEVFTLTDGRYAPLGLFGDGESFTSPLLNSAAVTVSALLPALEQAAG